MRFYAIGDVHGQLDMLRAAHARIEADRAAVRDAEAPVVHLGDLVDRGPDSRGVLDFVIEGRDSRKPWLAIRGNHDQLFSEYLETGTDPRSGVGSGWIGQSMGGEATLVSYGVRMGALRSRAAIHEEAVEKVPEAHRRFLKAMPVFHATRDLLFVHAGIRPGIPISQQDKDDLMWIRQPFLSDTRDHGLLVVHGHTPGDDPRHCGNRVNLDTGAAYGDPLTAAVFEGRDVWVLTETGRVPLLPPY